MNLIIQDAVENENPLSAMYADKTSAFDSLAVCLLPILYERLYTPDYVAYRMVSVATNHLRVCSNGLGSNALAKAVPTETGVPQGGICSPLRFLAAQDLLLVADEMSGQASNYRLQDDASKMVPSMCFVDDLSKLIGPHDGTKAHPMQAICAMASLLGLVDNPEKWAMDGTDATVLPAITLVGLTSKRLMQFKVERLDKGGSQKYLGFPMCIRPAGEHNNTANVLNLIGKKVSSFLRTATLCKVSPSVFKLAMSSVMIGSAYHRMQGAILTPREMYEVLQRKLANGDLASRAMVMPMDREELSMVTQICLPREEGGFGAADCAMAMARTLMPDVLAALSGENKSLQHALETGLRTHAGGPAKRIQDWLLAYGVQIHDANSGAQRSLQKSASLTGAGRDGAELVDLLNLHMLFPGMLYRLCRSDELVRNESGAVVEVQCRSKDPASTTSAADHVDQGSKKGTSKYVSTTKAFDAVVRLAAHTYANSSHYSSQLYVAVINAASSNVAYDLTSPEGREKAGITVGSSGDYFSNKFCEVLLTSPSTAEGKDAVGKGGVDVVAFFDIGPLVNWKRIETDLASTVFQLTGGESKALAGIMTKVKASFRKLPSYVPGPKHLKMVSDASLQDCAKCPGNMQLVRKLRAARKDVVEKGGGSDTVPIRSQVQSILETLKAADGTMVRFVAVWVHHQHGFKGEKGGWFPSLLKLLKRKVAQLPKKADEQGEIRHFFFYREPSESIFF